MSRRLGTVFFLAAVLAVAVTLHRFDPDNWPSLGITILHSLHGPGFSLVAVIVFGYFRKRSPSLDNYAWAAGIAMAFGLVSEIAQIPGPRDAQVKDLLVDALGIVGALSAVAVFDPRVRPLLSNPRRALIAASASIALAFTFVPTLWLAYALVQQERLFPTLLTFEAAWESASFGQTPNRRPAIIKAPPNWPEDSGKLSISTEDGRWGIFLGLHPVRDWRGYSTLSFMAASNGQPFSLGIAIRENRLTGTDQATPFYTTVTVTPEPQRFSIPIARNRDNATGPGIDLSRIGAVVFSAAKPGNKQEVLLDDIRLEP